MKRNIYFLLSISLLTSCGEDAPPPPPQQQALTTAAGVTVPQGVIYKEAGEQQNADARSVIADATSSEATEEEINAIIGEQMIAGPGIWDVLKDEEGSAELESTPTQVVVPYNGQTLKLEAVALQSQEEARKTWDLFRDIYPLDIFEIRPLNPAEMSLYWSVIPFPIEEPVFVLETEDGESRILMDLVEDDYTIFWMDDLDRLEELLQPTTQ